MTSFYVTTWRFYSWLNLKWRLVQIGRCRGFILKLLILIMMALLSYLLNFNTIFNIDICFSFTIVDCWKTKEPVKKTNGLNVCVTLKFLWCWSPSSQGVDSIRRQGFGEGIRSCGWSPCEWDLCPMNKGGPREPPSPCEDTVRDVI